MLTPLAIFIGGGIGALCRWAITNLTSLLFPNIPCGVLLCNVTGSLLIGLLYGAYPKPNLLISAITIGALGGFTTFSSFSLEGLKLIEQQQFIHFSLYIILSVSLGVASCSIGYSISK